MNTPRQPWEQDPDKWKGKPEHHSFSTMRSKDVGRLTERNRKSVLDLLTINDVELPQLIAEGKVKPKTVVTYSRVEWGVEGNKVVPVSETILARANLYDLSQWGKTHCIGVGRYQENLFKPCTNENGVDRLISREHGLVLLIKDGKRKPGMHYHDIGTQHKGSTNGSYLNDNFGVHNLVMPWEEGDYISMGNYRILENKNVRNFRLRYKTLGEKDV